MKKWGMEDCETFVRGTIRFKGFSFIISNFHDKGLTSDDPVPSHVKTLRDLALTRSPLNTTLSPEVTAAIQDSFENLSKED